MAKFSAIWKNHVGRGYVCDQATFGNQCAMRMAKALEDSNVLISKIKLKRCHHYSNKFKSHSPGHVRSAQELANVFYRKPKLLGVGVKLETFNGSINKNLSSFKNKKGMVFIMNGWGNTDHIDVWDGIKLKMKGSADTQGYMKRGKQVWFWELR